MIESGEPGRRRKSGHDGNPTLEFALALRQLRAEAGNPSYLDMSLRTGCPPHVLSQADAGYRLPNEEALTAYVQACGGDVAWWKERLRCAREKVVSAGVGHVGRVFPSPLPVDRAAGAAVPDPTSPPAEPLPEVPGGPRLSGAGRRYRRRSVSIVVGVFVLALGAVAAAVFADRLVSIPGMPDSALLPSTTVTVAPGTPPGGGSSAPATTTRSAPPGCRAGPALIKEVQVLLQPCISRQDDHLEFVSHVHRDVLPPGIPDTVTVYVWVSELNSGTRFEESLHRCVVTITTTERRSCGPYRFTPRTTGVYAAYTTVTGGEGPEYPSIWDSVVYTGTGSGRVEWNDSP